MMSGSENGGSRSSEALALIDEAKRLMQGARGWKRRLGQFSGLDYEKLRLIRKGACEPSAVEIGKLQSGLEKLRTVLAG